MCNVSDPTKNCASKEEIANYIEANEIQFKLFYVNYFPLLNNYDNPIAESIEYQYTFLHPLFQFLVVNNVVRDIIFTDNGFL
jgi:hypothetical protein